MNGRRLAPVGFAVAAAVLVLACFVLPVDPWLLLVVAIGGAAAAAAVIFQAARSRRIRGHAARIAPWLALAVGVALWAAASVALAEQVVGEIRTALGLPEALITLGFPWLVVGVVGVTSSTRGRRDLLAGPEYLIVALAASAALWLVAVDPVLDDGWLVSPWWFAMFVVVDVLVAGVALLRAPRPGHERSVCIAVAVAFLAAAVAHSAMWWLSLGDPPVASRELAAGMMVAPLLLGLSSLSSDGFALRTTASVRSLRLAVSWNRVIGLTVVAVVPITMLALVVALGVGPVSNLSIAVVAVSSAAVVCLVVARVWSMVAQVRQVAEHIGQVRLAAMVEYSNDVVMIVDDMGAVRYASPGLTGALGHRPEEWIGRQLLEVVNDSERDTARERLHELLHTGRHHTVEFETVLLRDDGQRRHGSVVMVNLLGDDAVDGVVVTFRDITEQRDLERQLSHRAFHDELTGLANRALFLDRMDHALRIGRNAGEPVMVLFIDLDDFKDVNDQHGHGVGDETLRVIARRIMETVASGDTAARLGGDEFAVLLEDGDGIDRAMDLAERLLASLRDPVTVHGIEVVVLASIGIAVAPIGASTTSLLRDADIAMYEAKRAGKGQVRIFDPAMRRIASRHLVYRNELTTAIEQEQLRVVYLPYVELASGEVRGAEALVRWHHPEHGEIAPAEFIPIAERTGLIVPIGRWVVSRALQQAATWRDDVELFVSVNLTAVELRQHDLLQFLDEAVRLNGLPTSRLMLEVTETDLMEGGERALQSVAALRQHGFGVALDDFGADLCSISHLQRHPVDMLKIDRARVAELGHGAADTSLARTLLQLAATLRVDSAAEGIEHPEQLHELRRSGCRLGQGYLLSGVLEEPVIARRFGRRDESLAGRSV